MHFFKLFLHGWKSCCILQIFFRFFILKGVQFTGSGIWGSLHGSGENLCSVKVLMKLKNGLALIALKTERKRFVGFAALGFSYTVPFDLVYSFLFI